MKKIWIAVLLIAALLGTAWFYRADIPYLASLAGAKETGSQQRAEGGGKGAGERAGQGAGQEAQGQGQGQGNGGRRRGPNGPVMVKTVAAATAALPMDVSATGWAEAENNTTLAAQQQGLVVEVKAEDGATVKKGDLIVKLDDRAARAAVEKDQAMIVRDQATLSGAEAALARARDLLTSRAGTQQALEQAKAAQETAAATVEADKAQLAADEVLLEHMEIRAPFDGRLGDIAVSPGAFVSAGTAITTVAQYDPIYVKFHLQERNLRILKQALAKGPVEVTTVPRSQKGRTRKGVISFYDNAVDSASGTIIAKAKFENASGALWPGESVNVVVRFNAEEPQVVVPTVAVSPGVEGFHAFVVSEGKVKVTPVTVARENGGFSAIAAGLKEGDHVVVEGQAQLADGQAVHEQFDDKALKLASTAAEPTGAIKTAEAAE